MESGMLESNRAWVDKALLLLRNGLRPFVERELEEQYGPAWAAEAQRVLDAKAQRGDEGTNLDIVAIFDLILDRRLWQEVFARKLRRNGHPLVRQLCEVRNRWAHQEPFSGDDVYWMLHAAYLLLTIVAAPEAQRVQHLKSEMRRQLFDEYERTTAAFVAGQGPRRTPNELEEQLFNLEHAVSLSAADRDRMRRDLARRLNGAPVWFSPQDEWLLLCGPVRTNDILRPAFHEDGTASLDIKRLQDIMGPANAVTHQFAGPMRDEHNPFGLLYPRWQYPSDAGSMDEAGELWTPFITLDHPRLAAWIATTVAGVRDDNQLRRSRETFIFDDALGCWRRTIDQYGMTSEDLLLRQHGDQLTATTREMSQYLNDWLDRWVPRIDETL
jgi:hypothetical protein